MKKAIVLASIGMSASLSVVGCVDTAWKDAPFEDCPTNYSRLYKCPEGISCKTLDDGSICRQSCPDGYKFVSKCDDGIKCKVLDDKGICDEKCPVGYIPADNNICPTTVEEDPEGCVTLASDRVCRRGGKPCTGTACQNAGANCPAGYITVTDTEKNGNSDIIGCDMDVFSPDEYNEEQYEDFMAGKRYPCIEGYITGRYCRMVIDEQQNPCDLSRGEAEGCTIFPILEGQVCTPEQLNPPANSLRVHIIDVGNGDAIWIQTPTGQNVLIDGGDGGSFGVVSAGPIVRDYLEFHGFAKGSAFDAVFLSHPHADHFGGFKDIFGAGGYTLKNYIDPMAPDQVAAVGAATYTSWINNMKGHVASESNIYMPASAKWTIGQAMPSEFFGPEVKAEYLFSRPQFSRNDANSTSIFFKLTYAGRSFIFGGDGEKEEEAELMQQAEDSGKTGLLDTNFLKVCHHGSDTSSSAKWLETIWEAVSADDRGAFISSGRRKYSGTRTTRPEIVDRISKWMTDDKLMFLSTNAADDNKESDRSAVRDDNILVVVAPEGTKFSNDRNYYACYEGVN